MNRIAEIKTSLCTGCGVCKNVCPVSAIEMRYEKGYLTPEIDSVKCIRCRKCEQSCPVINKHRMRIPQVFAAWADDETRFKSSSGGAFTVLAKKIFAQGGVVFGAAWTNDFYVKHIYIESDADLPMLQRSKYVQSDLGDSYQQVRKFLETGRKVMFVGTPCQVAGLELFLEDCDTKNLISVDFICYYNPPIDIVRKYLDEKYGLNNLSKFSFRDKSNGWRCHCTMAQLKDGTVCFDKKVDAFFEGYFKGLYARSACNQCDFSGGQHHSDVTLGDFWKIEEHDATWNDGKGTSMMIANTKKGLSVIKTCKKDFCRCENVPMDWICKGQCNCKVSHSGKDYFEDLITYKPFDESVYKALNHKYDIGMVCVQSYKNYGSAFTNFALYKVLKDLRYSVLLITQPLSSEIKPETKNNFVDSPFQNHENAKHYATLEDMKELNERCNMFLVGSDQVFNYEIYKKIDGFVKLDWVDDKHKKMCYATSFGVDRILGTFEESIKLKHSLSRFSHVSLREESGVELVKTNFHITASQVLDPVFLCNKKYYENLCKDIHISCGGIFAYILDPDEKKGIALKMLSQDLKGQVTALADRWMTQEYIRERWDIPTLIAQKNEVWLKLLMESDFVFTDSYHGMCMAIIFEKQFAVINNRKRGSTRFISLLRKLKLEERIFDTTDEFLQKYENLQEIHYEEVNKILSEERKRSLEWLVEALED